MGPDGDEPWTILVVDDDPDIRRIAALALERIGGFRVELAAGADEALAIAGRRAPDVVLLDASMPGTDGPATLKALRALPQAANVPVIFFTATSGQGDAARLEGLGAIGIVAKPFELSELPRQVREIVLRSRG